MKKFYFLALISAFSFMGKAQPGNYLVNGSFEDNFRGWTYFSGSAATVNFSIDSTSAISGNKSAKLEITGTGAQAWESSLQQRFTVHKDKEVQVSFKIKASTATFINLEVCRAYGDYDPIIRSTANLVATNNIAVNTTVQTITYTATPSYSDADFYLSFMLGTVPAGVTIWIDDVEIHQTDNAWDGNILPNSELDELWPTDSTNPAYRTANLAYSSTPWDDGGWEGGFEDNVTYPSLNVVYGVDSTGKLSGPNSFEINVVDKPATANDFWNAFNFIHFWAHKGETYEFSFEVMSTKSDSFTVAMNEQPWGTIGDHFFLTVNATPTPQTITIQTTRPADNTMLHKVYQANFPVGSNYKIWIDNVRLVRLGAADTSGGVGIDEKTSLLSHTSVYPNPSSDGRFTIDLAPTKVPVGKSFLLGIYSLEGKELLKRNLINQAGKFELNTGLPKGSYVLRIQCEDNTFIKKLIVK